MLTPLLIALVVGYLLGSLPFGYVVARSKGVNIFEVGSKNPGATNVRRVLGPGPGNLVFFLDAAKGALATGIWKFVVVKTVVAPGQFDPNHYTAIVGLLAALLGHSFSCFTKFRGGKGVATATGGLVVLMPLAVAAGAVVWVVTFYSSRYVSLASLLAAITMPIAAFLLHLDRVLLGLTVLIAAIVVLRHRSNIQRLMAGTESKFVKKSRAATAASGPANPPGGGATRSH